MGPEEILRIITGAIRDKKGKDIIVLDLRQITLVADYFVIVSASSRVHARAVCDHIIEQAGKNGIELLHREGYENSRWILLDYGSIVVHIFQPEERVFYNLERIWGDAPRWSVQESAEPVYGTW